MNGADLANCDRKVFRRGKHIASIGNLKAEEVEEAVAAARQSSGQRIDWHYFGGVAVVKALGNLPAVREHLEANLKQYSERFGNQPPFYRMI